MASKRIREWPQISISSPSWSSTQNEVRLNCQFTDCFEKDEFFANNSKHRHIIYRWKLFITTSMNSRSLPQNNASFGLDQLSKLCHFARKSVPMIQLLSSRMKGTNTTRRLRETNWNLEMAVGVARDSGSTPPHRDSSTLCHHGQRQLPMLHGATTS